MGRIKQMKKMVARLPGPIIINLRSGDFFFWQVKLLFATILDCLPTTPTLLDIPPPPPPFIPNPALKSKLLQIHCFCMWWRHSDS